MKEKTNNLPLSAIPNQDPLWYKDAIIYELHIKAFQDSNNDGIGDFNGLMERMDYLKDLGVTAIWLLPFYPSPQRDGGYDISDYFSINPNYGTVKQFKKMVKKARKLGLQLITELVLNHTSDQHPWFQRARKAPAGSAEREYYVWSDNPDKYKDARIIFQDFETSNWTWDPVAKAYFWHRFYSHQPDLNFDNPAVQEEVFRVIDFWCELGVDGFRLDAIPYLFQRDGTNCENLPETHVFLKKLRAHIEQKYPGKMFLAEANMWPEESAAYFGDGDECHMNYHFPIMPRLFMSVKMEDRYPITDIIEQTPEIPENCQWAMFLRNHDELTLEMVTDEERDYMYKAYNKEDLSKINLGIRHRLAPLLDNNRNKIELMNTLLFSLPGTPVIYYGDEIGMGDNIYLGDRDGVRTPMQWSADRNGGFSTTNPQKLFLPSITDPEYRFDNLNVDAQEKNTSSLLWWMKRVINMRKKFKAFSRGDIQFFSPENAKVLAFTRTYQEETILVLANLSRFGQAVELDLSAYQQHVPVEVFSHNRFPEIHAGGYQFTLAPHGYFWFLLENKHQTTENQAIEDKLPVLEAKNVEDILSEKNREVLETVLIPKQIKQFAWIYDKHKAILRSEIIVQKRYEIERRHILHLIVKVHYNEGLPEIYQIPLALVSLQRLEKMRLQQTVVLIGKVKINSEEKALIDALQLNSFQTFLLEKFAQASKPKTFEGFVYRKLTEEKISLKSARQCRISGNSQSGSALVYGTEYFLKLYRRLDATVHPDMEMSQHLQTTAEAHVFPSLLGSMELASGGKMPYILASIQTYIPNHGMAKEYCTDSAKRFLERLVIEKKELYRKNIQIDFLDFTSLEHAISQFSDLVGNITIERMMLLGQRTAEMHIALASDSENADFSPEPFSLHYQRSLYSALQTLVRESIQGLERNLDSLELQGISSSVQEDAKKVLESKQLILDKFKRIFVRKLDTCKIRTHSDLNLDKVLFTGKDFAITDFEGERRKPFSEKRLKRSPLRDLAGLILSLQHVARNAYLEFNTSEDDADNKYLINWLNHWYHLMAGLVIAGYLKTAKGQSFLPDNDEDLRLLLEIFLLERALTGLRENTNNHPEKVRLSLASIREILKY